MKQTYRIGSIFGTELRLHWSLLLGVFYFYWTVRPEHLDEAVVLLILVLLLFASIALHEVGHALAALRFDIPTRSIILWGLGGLAMLTRAPRRPQHELLIALAGPLVNLGIAAAVVVAGWGLEASYGLEWDLMLSEWLGDADWPLYLYGIGRTVVRVNLLLAGFNLLPIFPLDGGRMLRAAIQMGLGARRANLLMLIIGMPGALALLVYEVTLQQWLNVVIAALLLVAVSTLHPRAHHHLNLAWYWLTNRVNYHFLRGNYQQVIEACNQLIAGNPRNKLAYHQRAAAYHYLKDYPQALANYQRTIDLDPDNLKVYIDRATLWFTLKKYPEALTDYDQVLCRDPNNSAHYLQTAYIRIYANDDERALRDIDRAIELDPHSPAPYIMRGYLWIHRDENMLAENDFEEALRRDPSEALGFNNRGCVRDLRGDEAGALADYAQALKLDHTLALAYQNRGGLRIRNREYADGLADLEQAIALGSDNAEVYLLRAWVRIAHGELEAARNDVIAALNSSERDTLIHTDSWLRCNGIPHMDALLTCYAWTIEQLPTSALTYCGRADLYRVVGQYDSALADYDRACAADPQDARPYLGRALVAYQLGNIEQAQEDLEQVFARAPIYPLQRRAAQLRSALETQIDPQATRSY